MIWYLTIGGNNAIVEVDKKAKCWPGVDLNLGGFGMSNTRNSGSSAILTAVALMAACVVALFLWFSGAEDRAKNATARALVSHTADILETKRDGAGYDHAAGDAIADIDPWGTKIKVLYPVSAVKENFTVRSAGKDCQFGSNDDLIAYRKVNNFAGIGAGIRDNAGKVTGNIVEGAFTGAANGAVKATGIIKDAFKGEKKKEEVKTGD